ncbi:16S rRNA (adenine1518-N6/adenine1519-N6)-dimethyltransferase [Seinonella peptonophila]|uniref:Ribosomal RNA small subunit methyltransferase A n=1 Tax=Seinonella peptonophila TaxID=112248 RepID=A0A1M4YLL7_9BACL|nr:16S rRNA (adenine(1518)-N(6)/adenine(1519)-N(6))-dimethyltransferase RsmA [Seinonella peptonophila]SHF06684.1 16S rRNA (adenine1518-N6/adenine1519-N6)-dimethyltransferase [Seinonella peptonophila]
MKDEQRTISGQTKAILAEAKLGLKKSLGQNFLTDRHIIERIVSAIPLTEQSGVIEIGPGIGALTERLVKQAGSVVGIELDRRLLPVLHQLFATNENISFIHGDALKVDYHQLIHDYLSECKDVHVIANLPYYITSPLIIHLLEGGYPFQNIVIMIQKEVAERLMAQPHTKAYGSLTLFAQYYATVERVTHVSRNVFVPRPQVDSMVVKLTLRNVPPVQTSDQTLLFQIIRAAFQQRRKTLQNALHAQFQSQATKDQLHSWLQTSGIDGKRRGETLTLAEFAHIAKVFAEELREN